LFPRGTFSEKAVPVVSSGILSLVFLCLIGHGLACPGFSSADFVRSPEVHRHDVK
jgi:hypothetical protein